MIDGHCVRNLARSLVRLCLIEVPLVLMISASSRAQTFAVLHTFTGDDGSSPYAGVTVDRAGNLYGTTKYGGTASCDLGCGVLFKVAPQGSGWNFAALYKFAGPSDGKSPIARIVFGPDGRLYGTTLIGGNTTVNGGTVFTLTPPPTVCRASCYWVKTTLWSFGENDGDAHNPATATWSSMQQGISMARLRKAGQPNRLAVLAAARYSCCHARRDRGARL